MKHESSWGRFTARGGVRVEAEVRAMVRRASQAICSNIPPSFYRSMILHGGYGRGEGGIERIGNLERPHNNLDFLLITTLAYRGEAQAMKQRMDELLRPIVLDHGVGIDTGVINEWKLRASPCLVMWYDMRFGHKPVLGDASFVRSLKRFRRDAIDPSDMRDLLINRGTLLIINDMILSRGARTEMSRRFIVKHAMKAIIGYGDAYLFAVGDYDWSYLERQRRMRARKGAPAALRELYDEAMEFRFEPSYDKYIDRDLGQWMARLRTELSEIHLFFERVRLREPSLSWKGYAERALQEALLGEPLSARSLLQKSKNLLRGLGQGAAKLGGGLFADLAVLCNGHRGNQALAFPAVLYGEGGEELAEVARRLLGAQTTSPDELRRAYLEQWGSSGDTNFVTTARKLELPLRYAGGAA